MPKTRKVLITYIATVPGIFFKREYEGNEIADIKKGESVADVLQRRLARNSEEGVEDGILVRIKDYKII